MQDRLLNLHLRSPARSHLVALTRGKACTRVIHFSPARIFIGSIARVLLRSGWLVFPARKVWATQFFVRLSIFNN